ncbi:hypothetical protein TK90_1230 [Thioalkalivibrio sp. K90mix]|nr:hypothetical protein TK90_1230 [Thioalkalivibrio sp. K90mix]
MSAPVAPQRGGARGQQGETRDEVTASRRINSSPLWRAAMLRAWCIRYHQGPDKVRAVRRWRVAIVAALEGGDR